MVEARPTSPDVARQIAGFDTPMLERQIQLVYTNPVNHHTSNQGQRLLAALWAEFYTRVDDEGNDRA